MFQYMTIFLNKKSNKLPILIDLIGILLNIVNIRRDDFFHEKIFKTMT